MYHILQEGTNFSYLGVFNDSLTDSIIKLQEASLESQADFSKLKKRVSFLVTEGFQNVVRHGADVITSKKDELPNFFNIQVLNDFIGICSCNIVSTDVAAGLKEKIEEINKLSVDELKEMYIKILSTGEMSNKGGAGLGLIEMARKTGKRLYFSFKDIDSTSKLFFLSMFVGVNADDTTGSVYHELRAEEFDFLKSNNVILSYQGEFSDSVIDAIIQMLKANEGLKNSGERERKIVAALIESLHNITKHGKIIEGVRKGFFTLKNSGETMIFEAANSIEENDAALIEEAFDQLKDLNPDEIEESYHARLRSRGRNPNEKNHLGLFEIARHCRRVPEYEISKSSEQELIFKITLSFD